MMRFKARQEYTRRDLEYLKQLDRKGVLGAIESFEDRGLSDDEFVRRFAERLDPEKFPGLEEALSNGNTTELLESLHCGFSRLKPSSPMYPLREGGAGADEIMRHCFAFHYEKHQLPDDIDWDFNPGNSHWAHDLNRFTFLYPLVDAWQETGEKKYGRKAVELILDWVKKSDIGLCFKTTPYMFGSYLNNSIHCNAWCVNIGKLYPAGLVSDIELVRILKSIYDQVAYLEIMTAEHCGNWATIGNHAMARVVAAYPVEKRTDRWCDFIAETLDGQIRDQVYEDGAQYELAPGYHWLVAKNIIGAQKSLKDLGKSLPETALKPLARMVRFAQQHVRPEGGSAAFNDCDPEIEIPLAEDLAECGEEALLSPPESLDSEYFPVSGRCILRDRADRGDFYMAFDAGPLGCGGHMHQDKLSFVLSAYGKQFLTDPGRHFYDFREGVSYILYLRRTEAHNTVIVDGKNQNEERSAGVGEQPPARACFTVQDDEVRAGGIYDSGYGDNNEVKVGHERSIVFNRKERFWIVFDRLFSMPDDTAPEHTAELRFQFVPAPVVPEPDGARTNFTDSNLLVKSVGHEGLEPFRVCLRCGEDNPRAGWYSPFTGKVLPAHQLGIAWSSRLPLKTATLLLPYPSYLVPEVVFEYEGDITKVTIDKRVVTHSGTIEDG